MNDRDTRADCHGTTEARVRHLGGRPHPGPPVVTEARAEAWGGFSHTTLQGNHPCQHLFQTWQFQKWERIILYWSKNLTLRYFVTDRHRLLLRRVLTLLPPVFWATTFSAMTLYQYNLMYFLVFKNMSKYLVHRTQDSYGFMLLYHFNGISWMRASLLS